MVIDSNNYNDNVQKQEKEKENVENDEKDDVVLWYMKRTFVALVFYADAYNRQQMNLNLKNDISLSKVVLLYIV
jgi:hypothetical protein